MAVKACCIENCQSSSTRKEDIGVTFHKYPKETSLFNKWVAITLHTPLTSVVSYVCSRHFCKTDFKSFEDSKFKLKSDSIPSIFSWTMENKVVKNDDEKIEDVIEDLKEKLDEESATHKDSSIPENKDVNSNKESETENVDAIQKFIDGPVDKSEAVEHLQTTKDLDISTDDSSIDKSNPITDKELTTLLGNNDQHDSEFSASNIVGMILNNAETNVKKKCFKSKVIPRIKKPNTIASTSNKGEGSMALSIGSKVEVRDFDFIWHPSEIVEVDFEEMEVLVRYENPLKKSDEWLSINSPRIRPFGIMKPQIKEEPEEPKETSSDLSTNLSTNVDNNAEEKPSALFAVGERVLARWRDNRRFMATVTTDLGNENYEVLFDDGFKWTCPSGRLSKSKKTVKIDPTDSPGTPNESQLAVSPSNPPTPFSPPFHTHLFDPARDYLGSKSERRALKRKLNIKEIFNIGQKKMKKKLTPTPKKVVEKKPKTMKKKIEMKDEDKHEIPAAVASIIGSDAKEEAVVKEEDKTNTTDSKMDSNMLPKIKLENIKEEIIPDETVVIDPNVDVDLNDESEESKDSVLEEEQILENFEKPDDTATMVIDRIKEAIIKLEVGLYNETPPIEKPNCDKQTVATFSMPEQVIETNISVETPPPLDKYLNVELTVPPEELPTSEEVPAPVSDIKTEDPAAPVIPKISSKVKKSKKLRLLQEKKVERQVQKVKSELEQMKKQMEEMRKQMLVKTEEFAKQSPQLPESFLLPGEWCCKWVNRQPVGTVSEVESEVKFDGNNKPVLPRRSVQVEDKRLPEGWAKHMVRRSFGNSAGKWDIVLVSPENRRFHTRVEMKHYLDLHPELKEYERALLDFGVHIKLARRMGWVTETPDGATESPAPLPIGTLSTTSPLYKKKQLSLSKNKDGVKKKRKYMRSMKYARNLEVFEGSISDETINEFQAEDNNQQSPIEEGFVWVGSLKVQIVENLLRCPAEGCFKNFRNNTLIKMHIKHYHRELRKMLGATPKVLDLAYERTKPDLVDLPLAKKEFKTLKVKIPRPPKVKAPETATVPITEVKQEQNIPTLPPAENITPMQDSPKLRVALNKPVKRPKVLLPVRRALEPAIEPKEEVESSSEYPDPRSDIEPLDFETAISTHTVTKPLMDGKLILPKQNYSDDDEYDAAPMSSDVDTRSSFPRSGSPDSKSFDNRLTLPPASSGLDSMDERDQKMYMFDENGDRIRIVQMKREEIINCHCGFREEDGLMVQCELCLCWQHALCLNIQREADVPEKYTCSICLNPRRGRRSKRFLHDQDRLYEGLLPGSKPCESLRISHESSGNLLKIRDALHALRVTYHVATKKDHPKLYLWAKDWEATELSLTQERLNSDYSDLNIMISDIGKENLPIKDEQMQSEARTLPTDEQDGDRLSQKDGLPQCLLNGLLSSPSCASLDLPISTSDLERLAKSVQEQESSRLISAPEPEAAIDNSVCRERLLRHIQRCQALVDARLDCIDAQVAELESQDPSFEDDETADYFPRTKQTIQMLMRDLDVMEELGIIT